ncbi:MAG: hypothetical protein J7J98_08045 [candidate division Zixibacteria bacterium]|nr:hypothetical protein [candidate division Zixibacteria bacterium]
MFPFPAVRGDSTIGEIEHFGSLYTMADYETKAQNVYLSISGSPTAKLRLSSTLMYNKSTGEYDQVNMPDPSIEVSSTLVDQDFTFDDMHEYSNLDYSMIQVSLGLSYKLADGVTFTADGEYADLTDDAGYVYGIESGSLFMVRSGMKFDF